MNRGDRKRDLARRKAAKAAQMLMPGEASRYAQKVAGEISPVYKQTKLCRGCLCRHCVCGVDTSKFFRLTDQDLALWYG